MTRITGNLGARMRSSCSGRVGTTVNKVLAAMNDDMQQKVNQSDIIDWFNECQQILAEDGYWKKTDVVNVLSGVSSYNLMQSFLGADKVLVGGFGSDASWTKGAGWVLGGTVATHTTANATALSETVSTVVVGETYELKYTIATVTTAGTLTVTAGGQTMALRVGIPTTTAQTYTEVFTATTTGAITFTADLVWAGTLDNVSLTKVATGDLVEVYGVKWQPATGGAGDTASLKYIPSWLMYKEINSRTATTSPPYGYYLENDILYLAPSPNATTAGGLEIYYSYIPADLQCTTSYTFFTPKAYDSIYQVYALLQANKMDSELGGSAEDKENKVTYYEQKFEGMRAKLMKLRG